MTDACVFGGGGEKRCAREAKDYPEQMQAWCRSKIEDMRGDIALTQKTYSEHIVHVPQDTAAVDTLHDATRVIEAAYNSLDNCYDDWKRSSGSEVKKLLGEDPELGS